MTNRVEGKSANHEEAIKEIKSQSGIKYDPEVVEAFLKVISDQVF